MTKYGRLAIFKTQASLFTTKDKDMQAQLRHCLRVTENVVCPEYGTVIFEAGDKITLDDLVDLKLWCGIEEVSMISFVDTLYTLN